MPQLRQGLSKFKYSWELILFLSVLTFVAAKLAWPYKVVPYDPEEIFKLKFLEGDIGLLYFFPGFHERGALYGHPGLWQAITYIFTLIFGNSIHVIRAFMLCTSVTLVGVIYYLCRRIAGRLYAFFCALAFLCLPMFYIQSDLYFFEIPSMLFGLLAIRYYIDRKTVLFFICAVSAVFILESWVALPVAVLAIEVYRNSRDRCERRLNPMMLASSAVIILLALFFTWEYLATGHVSNHIVYLERTHINHSFLSLDGLYAGRFGGFFPTLRENFGLIGSGLLVILITSFLLRFKLHSQTVGLAVSSLVSLQVLAFFVLFDAYSGGRDYYPVAFYLIAIALAGLRSLCQSHLRFASCALVLWASFMTAYLPNNIFAESSYQTTFHEAVFSRSYRKLKNFLQITLEKEELSSLSRSAIGEILCNSYFNPTTSLESIRYKFDFDGDIAIFSERVPAKWLKRLSGHKLIKVHLPRRRKLNVFVKPAGGADLPEKVYL